jgi:hypothetical protein
MGQVPWHNLAGMVIEYAEPDRHRLGASISVVSP